MCVGANIFACCMFVRYRVVARSNILPVHSCHWEGGWALGNLRFFYEVSFSQERLYLLPKNSTFSSMLLPGPAASTGSAQGWCWARGPRGRRWQQGRGNQRGQQLRRMGSWGIGQRSGLGEILTWLSVSNFYRDRRPHLHHDRHWHYQQEAGAGQQQWKAQQLERKSASGQNFQLDCSFFLNNGRSYLEPSLTLSSWCAFPRSTEAENNVGCRSQVGKTSPSVLKVVADAKPVLMSSSAQTGTWLSAWVMGWVQRRDTEWSKTKIEKRRISKHTTKLQNAMQSLFQDFTA